MDQPVYDKPTSDWVQQTEQLSAQDDRTQPWKKALGDKVGIGFENEEKEDIILALKNNAQHNNVAA